MCNRALRPGVRNCQRLKAVIYLANNKTIKANYFLFFIKAYPKQPFIWAGQRPKVQ
jgi:hypothetical protein